MKIITTKEGFVKLTPQEKLLPSIFLAGPTPRPGQTWKSWRHNDAIEIFERIGFDGILYLPEPFVEVGKTYDIPHSVALNVVGELNIEVNDLHNGSLFMKDEEFAKAVQAEWERHYLYSYERVDVILFWVPRVLTHVKETEVLALTTNTEFGEVCGELKTLRSMNLNTSFDVVYGRPIGSGRNEYHDRLYRQVTGRLPLADLTATCILAMNLAIQQNEKNQEISRLIMEASYS